MRQAVFDIGTNTCLLLIAESTIAGSMRVVNDVHAIARLGAGVDDSRIILDDSYQRLRLILQAQMQVVREAKADAISATGTSVLRDANNRQEIIEKIRDEFGIELQILSGADESRWSYQGAVCGLPPGNTAGTLASLDIGGGSTELSFGENGEYRSGKSMNIGAVRIKERFLSKIDPVSIATARTFVRAELAAAFAVPPDKTQLVAVAGTPTALAAMKLGLKSFDPERVNHTTIRGEELSSLCKESLALTPQELCKKYPAVHPSRSDILPAGAIILDEVVRFLNLSEIRVSTYGLRYGIMIRELERSLDEHATDWKINHE